MDSLGYHYRLTEIQATLGISQLKKINKFIAKRKRVAAYYDKSFKGDDRLTPLQVSDKNISAHHLYPVKIHFDRIRLSRNELMIKLRKHGIMTQVHYIPIPLHPYYRSLGYSIENLPNAMKFYFQILSIPIYPKMSLSKQKKVVKILKILVQ